MHISSTNSGRRSEARKTPPFLHSQRQVTFHEEDWKTWKEVAEPARALTAPYFSVDSPPETQSVSSSSQSPTSAAAAAAEAEEGQDRSRKRDDIRQPSGTTTTTTSAAGAGAPETESPPADDINLDSSSSGAGSEATNPGSTGANAAPKKHPAKSSPSFRTPPASAAPTTDQAGNDRLCQAIADRVEVRFEGRGGKLALRAPRRRGDGSGGTAGASGGHRGFAGGAGGGAEGGTGLQDGEDDGEDGDDDDGSDGGGDSDGSLYGGGGGVGGGRGLGSDETGNQDQGKVREVV